MRVDITGLNKTDVLLALYVFALSVRYRPLEKYFTPDELNRCKENASGFFSSPGQKPFGHYLDYVNLGLGPINFKIDLKNDTFDPSEYDQTVGPGAAKQAIADLRGRKYAALPDGFFSSSIPQATQPNALSRSPTNSSFSSDGDEEPSRLGMRVEPPNPS